MGTESATGFLLVNLGTPDAPTPDAVGRYLREFLQDGYVIDIPQPFRWALVNVVIVPRRRYASAKLYQKIFDENGSPLLHQTRELAARVGENLRARGLTNPLSIGMRYGQPSIRQGLEELRAAGAERFAVFPLYPQYAESSYETAVAETKKQAAALGCLDKVSFLPPFYDRAAYLEACAARVREFVAEHGPEYVLFSFHSLPERHIRRLDQSGAHCLKQTDCCAAIADVNRNCYRAHSFHTARAVARLAGLEAEKYGISFQSRLGRAAWLGPQTEDALKELAAQGRRQVAVFCPSFVADCLETLEEIGFRARDVFQESGGAELKLIPSLNTHPLWVECVADWLAEEVKA
jgi:ferrochelatase